MDGIIFALPYFLVQLIQKPMLMWILDVYKQKLDFNDSYLIDLDRSVPKGTKKHFNIQIDDSKKNLLKKHF
jgi:hypothetical protein